MRKVAVLADPESTLAAGALLSAIGGFLDAYTYVGHGGVFANTQSGNVLFSAIAIANARWSVAIRHIPPIVALLLGTISVRAVQAMGSRYRLSPAPICLIVETLILLGNAALPHATADYLTTVSISFAAALQWSAFSTIEGWNYTSIATTGNLRQLADAVFGLSIHAGNPGAGPRARAFVAICAGFSLGAIIGAVATRAMGNIAAALPAVPLIGMLVTRQIASRSRSRG
jgi:uncharacterized membrane protein YoaK (UPF0700 family)